MQRNADQKDRWGGLLENPVISKVQRDILDGGRSAALSKILSPYSFRSVVDVGCGTGETSEIFMCSYLGIDNSFPRICHASQTYPLKDFLVAEAQRLPFFSKSFQTGLLIDTSHHLIDDAFLSVLREMCRLCYRYLIVSDPVYFSSQSTLSRYFYKLDRGGCFRTAEQMKAIFQQVEQCALEHETFFMTRPGLYRHHVFVLGVKGHGAPVDS